MGPKKNSLKTTTMIMFVLFLLFFANTHAQAISSAPYVQLVRVNYDACYLPRAKDNCRRQEVTLVNPLYERVTVTLNCGPLVEEAEFILWARTKQTIEVWAAESEELCRIKRWHRVAKNPQKKKSR